MKIGVQMMIMKIMMKNKYLNNIFKNIKHNTIMFYIFLMENQSLEDQAKSIVMDKLIKLIKKYPDKDWNWGYVETMSKNPNITMEFIDKYPNKDWDWNDIETDIIIEIIEKYPDKNWDWEKISNNIKLTIEIFDKYPDKPWKWWYISKITIYSKLLCN